jgi:hypothetical protein
MASNLRRWTAGASVLGLGVVAAVGIGCSTGHYEVILSEPLDAGEDTTATSADTTGDGGASEGDGAARDAQADTDNAADASIRTDAAAVDSSDASSSPCDAGSPAGNLVQNWSFECGLAPWYAWSGAIDTTTAISHSGNASVLASNRSEAYLGPVQDLTAALLPGGNYSASAWATVGPLPDGGAPAPQPVSMTVRYSCTDDGGAPTYVQVGMVSGVLPGSWTEVDGVFTMPCMTIDPASKIELYIAGPAAGVDLYVDDVVVR